MNREAAYLAYYRFFDRTTFQNITEFRASQYITPEMYSSKQDHLLSNLLNHACKHVPYYQNLLSANDILTTSQFTVGDLPAFPVLTKEIIRHNQAGLFAQNLDESRRRKNSTSGTTGTSLYFLSDAFADKSKTACMFLQHDMMGEPMLSRTLSIWAARFEVAPKHSWLRGIANKTKNRMIIYADLSASGIADIIGTINAYKPVIISSYPSTLEFIVKSGQLKELKHFPRVILLSGEKLLSYQRQLITDGFKGECFDYYGARDGSMIAQECTQHDGLHIFGQNVIVEVVDEKNHKIVEGAGRILITDLHNYVMPFIRYEIGDIAEVHPEYSKQCACGRQTPRLKQILSRSFDIVRFPNGKAVVGTYWPLLMKSQPGIKKFKVQQKKDGSLFITIVRDSDFTAQALLQIRRKIMEQGGERTRIEFIVAADIPSHPQSGKYRFVESEYRD